MRANWRMGREDRKKWVKMNHAAWMRIGLLEGTNSRSESRNLFGLEANAHEKNVRVRKHILCGVLSFHPVGFLGIAIACEHTTLKNCTRLSSQSSPNMIANLCGSVLLLPVSRCSCRHWHMIATARKFDTLCVSLIESFCYRSPVAPEVINTWTYYAEPSWRCQMHSDSNYKK